MPLFTEWINELIPFVDRNEIEEEYGDFEAFHIDSDTGNFLLWTRFYVLSYAISSHITLFSASPRTYTKYLVADVKEEMKNTERKE